MLCNVGLCGSQKLTSNAAATLATSCTNSSVRMTPPICPPVMVVKSGASVNDKRASRMGSTILKPLRFKMKSNCDGGPACTTPDSSLVFGYTHFAESGFIGSSSDDASMGQTSEPSKLGTFPKLPPKK